MEQTIEKLLHKEFDAKMRGYDKDQVDDFLDEVIEDIEKLQKKYSLLLDEKKILEKNNFELKMKLLELKDEHNNNKYSAPMTKPIITNSQNDTLKIQKPKLEDTQPKEPNDSLLVNTSPITYEDSKADDHTLQDRIEQLERELSNIKNFKE